MPGAGSRAADVEHEQRAQPAVGEELAVDAGGVEAGHRPGGEAGRADADDEVTDLQGGVEPCLCLSPGGRVCVAGEPVVACGRCGKSRGRCSWNAVSAARIATSGAAAVLARLPSLRCGSNRLP